MSAQVVISGDEAQTLVDIRRHLHQNPELSHQESQTAIFIEKQLQALGLQTERVAENGVVTVIEGAHPGPTLGFRADIDALPITELSSHDYVSTNPGVMHACGHDVHTTVGIGVARALVRAKDHIHGRIKMIFQPAEEASPVDEPIGAERMAQEGVLENPDVDAVFAFHCMPDLEVGKVGYTQGPVWARSDLVEIEITGQKTHAAYPHEGIDAVVVASHVITALQTVTSRRIDTRDACVLSIGHLEAGNSYNIIAESAQLTGILRSLADETSKQAYTEIERIATHVALGLGATANVKFTPGARLTANDVALENRTVALMRDVLGDDALVLHKPQLGAEDFCAFSTRVPGCYLFLGVRNEAKGITHMIHTPYFDVDEACMPLGVKAMTHALIELGKTWVEP